MDADSRWRVMGRALMYGAWTGAVIGGPGVGAFCLLLTLITGPSMIVVALAVTVIGGAIGAAVGLVSAVLPGLVMATARGYLRSRLQIARLVGGVISGLEVDTVFVAGHDGLHAAAGTDGGITFLVSSFVLFAVAGACSPHYVLGDRTLMSRRCSRPWLRWKCPCRRSRLGAVPAA